MFAKVTPDDNILAQEAHNSILLIMTFEFDIVHIVSANKKSDENSFGLRASTLPPLVHYVTLILTNEEMIEYFITLV